MKMTIIVIVTVQNQNPNHYQRWNLDPAETKLNKNKMNNKKSRECKFNSTNPQQINEHWHNFSKRHHKITQPQKSSLNKYPKMYHLYKSNPNFN